MWWKANNMNKIKRYLNKVSPRTDSSGLSVFGRGQSFDWEILLIIFLFMIIVFVSFSVYVFLGVRAGDIFQDNDKVPIHNETINREVLDRTVNGLVVHTENLKKLQSQRPVFIDPSL
jgi:hypothetical protein